MNDRQSVSAQPEAPAFRVSRRSFLQAAGAGAAIAAGSAAMGVGAIPFRASRAAAQGSWDQEADIVVVGSGAAALSAAITAQSLGNAVVMLEKAETVGGTTAKSGGVYWIPNNHLMREAGVEDGPDAAVRYMARCAYPQKYDSEDPNYGLTDTEYALIEAFYENGPTALQYLEDLGALSSIIRVTATGEMFPDYYAQLPENGDVRGRALVPLKPDGTPGAGNELVRQLQTYAEGQGITAQTGQRVVAVIQNDAGEVVGVETVAYAPAADGGMATPAATPMGTEQRTAILARKGVIFGSGGFTHNPEMALNYLRGPIFGGCAVPTNEGDFINIGISVGAALGNMANAWWAEVPLEPALEFASTPADIFGVPGDSMIYVNKYGRRFVNEKIQYNERTQAHFTWDPVRLEFPDLISVMIYDERAAGLIGGLYPVPPADVEAPFVLRGETWDELATAIADRLTSLASATGGVQLEDNFLENLTATVERFNGFAESGVDEDFHRGETPIEFARDAPGAPDNQYPNISMYPISATGPYFAILIAPGTLDTKGGPKVNTNAQVLTIEGEPIPGLYGAGNCVASSAGQAYWAAGGTLGPALVFGHVAAMHANDQTPREA